MQHIAINKITKGKSRDSSGSAIRNPLDRTAVKEGWKIVVEAISLAEIKSARPWHRPEEGDKYTGFIEGPITTLYMKDTARSRDREDSRPAEIHIAESFEAWTLRSETIPLKDGETK